MKIEIPEFCLIAMVGVTSSGKSAFAGKHFKEEEILSSDAFRRMVSDDENDQSVTADAFELLYAVAEKRLSHRKTTVIDATNLRKDDRKKITELAKSQDVHTVAIVMDLPEKTILQRNAGRADRSIPEKKVRSQMSAFRQGTGKLKEEGFRFVYFIKSEEEADDAEIAYTKLWNDRKDEHGPFDIIGDVHGCAKELKELGIRYGGGHISSSRRKDSRVRGRPVRQGTGKHGCAQACNAYGKGWLCPMRAGES